MEKVKILLVGIGGYGASYINRYRTFEEEIAPLTEIVGVVDPVASKSSQYEWVLEQNIPVYNTMEEFYAEHTADLAVISTPTSLQQPMSMCALQHGTQVLCEKPIVPVLQDLDPLREAVKASGKDLAVGFQWSFARPLVRMKREILEGKFGKPLRMRCCISWPRPLSYYAGSTWKGRISDGKGNFILDSIVTNATAHYLHNIFFMLGETMDSSRMPTEVLAEIYRAKDIETFDTCFLKGKFDNGCEFLYSASHSTNTNEGPRLIYEFEKATFTYNVLAQDGDLIATFADGTQENYGPLLTEREEFHKLFAVVEHIRTGAPLTCTIETVVPHLAVCNAIFELDRVALFPKETLREMELYNSTLTYVDHLYEDLHQCFDEFQLPSEKKFVWASQPKPLQLENYTRFSGNRFQN